MSTFNPATHKPVTYSIKGMPIVVFGGPYRDYSPVNNVIGVKMAAEIRKPCLVDIPTDDFSVPEHENMVAGMIKSLQYVRAGNSLYVGCMGGVGRTGLFMGVLAKVAIDANNGRYEGYVDPVAYVRNNYKSHAIETMEQMKFVREFDTSIIIATIWPIKHPTSWDMVVAKVRDAVWGLWNWPRK